MNIIINLPGAHIKKIKMFKIDLIKNVQETYLKSIVINFIAFSINLELYFTSQLFTTLFPPTHVMQHNLPLCDYVQKRAKKHYN